MGAVFILEAFQAALLAITCSSLVHASQWLEGGGGGHNLVGVPDLDHYGKLEYPKFELQELGTETHGEIPPKTVKILKTISYKVPQPYPVHIPFKVPYPVHVEKPIPVVQTKIVKISHPIPIPVEKSPSQEFQAPESSGSGGWIASGSEGTYGGSFSEAAPVEQHGGFGGSFSGAGAEQLQQSYGVPGQEPGVPLGEGDYASFGGGEGHGAEDRSGSYEALAQAQQEQQGGEEAQGQH